MSSALLVVHWVSAFVVLAEALNKIERTAPFARGLTLRTRVVDTLKAVAWVLMAIGAAGELAGPVLALAGVSPNSGFAPTAPPTVTATAVLAGFAVLIVRTRVKEG